MTTWTVSSTSDLQNALNSASGGDTIVLESGSYSAIEITQNFSSYVTIKSEVPHGAVFTDLDMDGASHIKIDGVHVEQQVRVDNSDHIWVANSDLDRSLYFKNNDHIIVDGNDIDGAKITNALTINSSDHFTVTNNLIHDAQADLMRVVSSGHGLIENNELRDAHPVQGDHPDGIQFGNWLGKTPHDIIMRGNLITDDPDTGAYYMQGIFMSASGSTGYKNILIEQNLINIGSPNSIAVDAGIENVVIQYNTLLPWPGGGGAFIRLGEYGGVGSSGTTVRGNISRGVDTNELTGASNGYVIGDNYTYSTNSQDANYWRDIFQVTTDGENWQDFVPVGGSPVDFGSDYGAQLRLQDLLSGGGSGTGSPVAGNDTATVAEDGSVTLTSGELLANDSDPDGDTLTITSVGLGVNGTAVLNGDGTITFSPDPDFTGTASFTYSVSDGNGGTDTATVEVNVTSTSDTPDAANDTASPESIAPVVIDVLGNDNDPDGDTLTVTSVTQGTNGSVAINADGTLTYTPYPWAFQGNDSFTYTISDGNGGTDTATVTVTPFPTPVFELAGQQFDGSLGDVINLPHDAAFAVPAGTVTFAFTASNVTTRQGLITKDAAGDGNHLAIYIDDGDLIARFQDGLITSYLVYPGLATGQEYAVAATFGPDGVELYVDGVLIGADSGLAMSLESNVEFLQIGGLGWGSQSGQNTFADPFTGQINDIKIFNQVLASSQVNELTIAPITGSEGADVIVGTEGNDQIIGQGGDDTLTGAGGDDAVNGGAGNDLIIGGSGEGNDIYDGGDDIDTLTYVSTSQGILINLTTGFGSGAEIDNDIIANIENVIGGDGDDIINGSVTDNDLDGGDGADRLLGQGGNDVLNGGDGDDRLIGSVGNDTLNGGVGNDFLQGNAGFDTLNGGDGEDQLFGDFNADVLRGGNDNDTLNGGAGGDRLFGDAGDDILNGDDGDDSLVGSVGNDQLNGGAGSDNLRGNAGFDTLDGGDGDDFLFGDFNADNLHGGAGNDALEGGAGNDRLFGDNGNDTLNGNDGADALWGGSGNDVLDGGADNDVLHGNAGFDTLNGGDGDDTLFGEFNRDILAGGAGNDQLNGGAGADSFVFADNAGSDTIQDWEDGLDVLDFTGVSSVTDIGDLTINAVSATETEITYNDGTGNVTLTVQSSSGFTIDQSDFAF